MKLAGVAINGSKLYESIQPNQVTYSIKMKETYPTGGGTDGNGNSIPVGTGTRWVDAGTDSTGAKINGYVSVPSSKMKISGVNVAKLGDITIETWEAEPPIPQSNDKYIYTATSPTSGTGQGKIISGSSKANLDGKPIALIGSQVLTCLDTITTIETGNTKMNFSK